MSASPIFVHSLFRSGSTYLFGVFRRSAAGYWCYQEPLNEHVRHVGDAPERLLEIDAREGSLLRHPALDKPYFWEFYQVKDAIAPLFRKNFSYDSFFVAKSHPSFGDLSAYFQALIDNARGRPVFQCCRTTGRLAALRDTFGGTHVHLWRNPHDQWWSYQVGDYFDATVQRIFNAADLPAPLAGIRDLCGIAPFHDPHIEKEFAYALSHRLAAQDAYVAFYSLWLYSLLACEKSAVMSVNIDALSTSSAYRQSALAALKRDDIDGLDLSDCGIAQAQFGSGDVAFFAAAEERVHRIFRDHGMAADALAAALDLRARHRPGERHTVADAAAASSRARDVAVRNMDSVARTQRELARLIGMLADAGRVSETQRIDRAVMQRKLEQHESMLADARRNAIAAQAELDVRQAALAEALARSSALAAGLADARLQLAAMSEDLAEATAHLDSKESELASARQRLDRLHTELAASGSRLEQAALDTHRWWTIADDTSGHLQEIYASRSWRLTAPLREINAWRKRLSGSTEAGVAALGSMPRSVVRRLLLAAWAHARGRPERRARFVRLLAPFPRLYGRLRAFAFAHATVPVAGAPAAAPHDESPRDLAPGNDVRWDEYPASVREIHSQLMRARAVDARTTSQRQPTQARR